MAIRKALLATVALLAMAPPSLAAHDPPGGSGALIRQLLRPGEQLLYTVRSSRFGDMGKAAFRVDGAERLGEHAAYVLNFDFSAKVAVFKVSDQTRSWLCTESLNTLRYTKRERSPIGRRDEDVSIDFTLGQWADGRQRAPLASANPLDELSFIYLVRSLDLKIGESLEIRRHFDVRRNPVHIEAVATDTVAGRDVVVYVMKVPDPRQKNGTSTLRFFISNDAARLPLRIESSLPVAGAITMTLASATILPTVATK